MDLREFFDNIFNIDDTIEDLEKSFIRGNFIFDDGSLRSNIRPRDLMLKNSSTIRRSTTRNGGHHSIDNFFESFADDRQQNIGGGSIASKSQSVIKEFKSDSNGKFEEKIVIKDSSGNEKIITKQSDGSKTVQREIHKKDDKIVQDKEIVSDIGG
ncbi:hypothetical protein HUG17_6013 [Dermatophagoides farinae]|uniref:Uncharacterized protein n=1 Tax=Dermatophagoides farinae TaxID=6954 RepID=A0A9D4P3R0_DERFA|nr:uncharacterized protein LOC124493559 [Dermatophagoides farinae]KAH7643651.1 hypothetical protein HUG17_6013 [Dermatophagoides farinae]